MKTEYIQYEELLKRQKFISNLKRNRVKLLFKKNRIKRVVGGLCLIIAIVPNGTGFILYPIGFYLLSINTTDIFKHKENLLRKLKCFIKMKGGFKK